MEKKDAKFPDKLFAEITKTDEEIELEVIDADADEFVNWLTSEYIFYN